MTISVDWPTGVVTVPQADTALTGTDPISGRQIRSYDTDQFHEELRDAEESVNGRAWPLTHLYNAESTLGGVTYAPQLIMVNSYQVEFEATVTPWRVVFTSTNNNIADFSVINHVSIQPGNSAGLQLVTTGGSALTSGEKAQLANVNANSDFHTRIIKNKRQLVKEGSSWYLIVYSDGEMNPPIMKKLLHDKSGFDITDIAGGVLSEEHETSV